MTRLAIAFAVTAVVLAASARHLDRETPALTPACPVYAAMLYDHAASMEFERAD